MVDTVLSIVTTVCNELGEVVPLSLANSTDPDSMQFLALANATGDEIAREGVWSGLTIEGATIALVAGQETYPLPADCDRIVLDTQWDRTNQWRTQGPDDPQTARWRRESVNGLAGGPRRAIRQKGAFLSVWPVPAAGDAGGIISYDYVSMSWAQAAGTGTAQTKFLTDADTTLFPTRLMILGLKYRWRAEKGFDFTVQRGEFVEALRLGIGRDLGGGEVINLVGRCRDERGNADYVLPGPVVTLPTA